MSRSDELWTIAQTARILGISEQHVRKLQKMFKPIRIGGRVYFAKSVVEASGYKPARRAHIPSPSKEVSGKLAQAAYDVFDRGGDANQAVRELAVSPFIAVELFRMWADPASIDRMHREKEDRKLYERVILAVERDRAAELRLEDWRATVKRKRLGENEDGTIQSPCSASYRCCPEPREGEGAKRREERPANAISLQAARALLDDDGADPLH